MGKAICRRREASGRPEALRSAELVPSVRLWLQHGQQPPAHRDRAPRWRRTVPCRVGGPSPGRRGRDHRPDLSGKLAIVTGATGQLGRVMVRTLGVAGADVAVHYRSDRDGAEELCEELRAMGRRACAVYADIGDAASINAMKASVEVELGLPDIVVTNAVQQYEWTTVLEQAEADYESQFRTCVMQNVLMAKAFVPAMQSKNWGRFIGISTECAMQVFPSQSAYTSGKRGMDAIIRVLAKEVGKDNITVNQVAPGWTISDSGRENGSAEQDSEATRSYVENTKTPLNRRGTDQEIGDC